MRKYLAATTLLIAIAIGPTSALGLSVGAKAGGIGVSASVGTGKNGASAGISARGGGVGKGKAGASVGRKGGSSLGAGGKVGGVGGGARVGSGKNGASAESSARGGGVGGAKGAGASTGPGGALRGSAAGTGSLVGGGVSTIAGIAPAKGARPTVALPRNLWPSATRAKYDSRDYPSRLPAPTAAISDTARAVVRVCRQAIASAASPFGAVRVRAASAGPLHRNRRGALTAPLAVRIEYAGQGGVEIRQARIRCHLDSSGRVVAVI
ncbi:helicase [Ensifer aridi]|uniref:helicase n=1 Tax=Ensifer aridi TaxID=1708715 RepID=UPI00097BBBF1|nr:helicase [Ensifer aridi]